MIRELATIIDPGNAAKFGAAMVGFRFQVSTAAGATANLLEQAEASPVATAFVEEDN